MLKKLNKKSVITTEIVTITPDMAATWLEANAKNRKIANGSIAKYAADMAAGNWQLTGEAIKFDTKRNLIDGQHRLRACVRANAPFQSVVIYGVPTEAQDVMDAGKPRSAADALSLRGLTNAMYTVSALRYLLAYKAGRRIQELQVTTTMISEALERHPNITKSVAACSHRIPRGMPRSALSFIHYAGGMFLRRSDLTERLLHTIQTGIPSHDGDLFHAFREKALAFGTNGHHMGWTLLHAWNHEAAGNKRDHLRLQKSFVEIDGLDRDAL